MKKRIIKVISKISILLLILLGYYFLNRYYNIAIPCLFHKFTNLYCPGCGITRCLFSLLEFNFIKAFNYNPLVTILLPPFIIYEVVNMYNYILNKPILKIPKFIVNLLLIITIIFGVLRNII